MTSRPLKLPNNSVAWPDRLRPIGEGSFHSETFADWWTRNRAELGHLPPDLCEQWIYRHWTQSPFAFLPLDTLECERRIYPGEKLLASIYRAFAGTLHPQFDYDTFQRNGGDHRHATALALDSGTWDYPMVLLSTPYGVSNLGKLHRDVRLVIIEGHQRHRYLNALHALEMPPEGPHEVLVVSSPLVCAS